MKVIVLLLFQEKDIGPSDVFYVTKYRMLMDIMENYNLWSRFVTLTAKSSAPKKQKEEIMELVWYLDARLMEIWKII